MKGVEIERNNRESQRRNRERYRLEMRWNGRKEDERRLEEESLDGKREGTVCMVLRVRMRSGVLEGRFSVERGNGRREAAVWPYSMVKNPTIGRFHWPILRCQSHGGLAKACFSCFHPGSIMTISIRPLEGSMVGVLTD